ncbi:ABC1 kinase family protein [Sporosarcina highlanderae]|uniref:AarF/ABC1/UbiB kinase family protein n=1 Tax=Sporosarcina highlanderae TaxID=3035916 RepID=A0ABT8JRB9_9BACL|nr:AarF/ABC1/UbiB kinase family protein [Sporosarcina highlanderae]MDN4606719.1 AarF/ABC1/UbiB kinase family protein [Sporosarcina highlanderae]
MKIRHTKRFKEIIYAFIRNGLSVFLFRLGLISRNASKHDTTDMNMQEIGDKLRLTLQELGPTFIKLGQIASSRRDLVPPMIAFELEKLLDHVTPVPFAQIREIVQSELEGPLEQFFSDFSEEPLATASIGQVHVARLHSGEQVAVKVQRPDIRPTMETDLTILSDLAKFLEERVDWAKTYRLQDMIVEFSRSLNNELDYRVEGRSCERIAKQFEKHPTVIIPRVHRNFSTGKVLTMDKIEGIKANDLEKLDEGGYDRKLIARRIFDSMLHQILDDGFFHGDPHPGNILILPGNVVSYLDFGMVGRLDNKLKEQFAPFILHMRNQNTEGMVDLMYEMGIISDETDLRAFTRDVDNLQNKYYDVSLDEISLGTIFIELFQVAYRHNIMIPTDIALLGKSILTLEGVISKLDPTLNMMMAVEPFGKKLMWKRYNPKKIIENSWVEIVANIGFLSRLPKELKAITTTIRKGKLHLDINTQQLKMFLGKLDQISNRLSFSIILLSLSILLAGLFIGSAIVGRSSILWQYPIIEAAFIIFLLMFFFLIYFIGRSNRK